MALSKDTSIKHCLGDFEQYPVKASSTIYEGGMVGLDSGYARALVAGDQFAGHCFQGAVETTAANGGCNVKVLSGTYKLQVTVTGVAVTDIGKDVYATDDATYALTATGTKVGKVVRYVTTNTAIVEFSTANVAGMTITSGVGSDITLASADDVFIKAGSAAADAVKLQVYDIDATAYVDAIALAGHATVPTIAIAPAGTALGFFGKTPATQQAVIADPSTDATNIVAAVASVIDVMQAFGLVATA